MVLSDSYRKSSIFSSLKMNQVPLLRSTLVVLILVFVGCQSQTFQYSRGWTNGKRSSYPVERMGVVRAPGGLTGAVAGQQAGLYETEGVPSLESQGSSAVPASGTFRLSVNGPQKRLRSLDYAQYLSKKYLGSSLNHGDGGNEKPAVWILSTDQENNSNGEF